MSSNLDVEIFQGEELISAIRFPAGAPGSVGKLEIADRWAPSVALRAMCGASTLADSPYRVSFEGISGPPQRGIVYVGPYSRNTFSWRASTALEEVITSLMFDDTDFSTAREAVAIDLMRMFHLEDVTETLVEHLSGGEAQRLALLLALVSRPKKLVVDLALSEQDRRRSLLLEGCLNRLLPALGIDAIFRSGAPSSREDIPSPCAPAPLGSLLLPSSVELRSGSKVLCRADDLTLAEGEVVFVRGDNGSGKSLLCRALLGSLPAGIRSYSKLRWGSGEPPSRSYAGQDVSLGFSHQTVAKELHEVSPRLIIEFEKFPGVRRSDSGLSPFELTPDKQRFVAFLKAIGSAPKLVVLDEPSEHWDDEQLSVALRLLDSQSSQGTAFVIATHDSRLLRRSRQVVLVRESQERLEPRIPPRTGIGSIQRLDEARLYSAWSAIHAKWPRSTLDIFENWSLHVDDLISELASTVSQRLTAVRLLDLGCGNGLQTLWFRHLLLKTGLHVHSITGLDWQPRAIEWARFWSGFVEAVDFCIGDITDADGLLVQSQSNMCTSFFVLHDLPKIRSHLSAVYNHLEEGGVYLGCLLNPEWVIEHKEQVLAEHPATMDHDAEFATYYMLPEDDRAQTFVPYFHRSADLYRNIFTACGFVVEFTLGSACPSIGLDLPNMPPQTLGFVAYKRRQSPMIRSF